MVFGQKETASWSSCAVFLLSLWPHTVEEFGCITRGNGELIKYRVDFDGTCFLVYFG